MRFSHLLLVLGLAGFLAQPALAQLPKIGSVDLKKVFDNYYKTKQADTKLKEDAAGLDKERELMIEAFKKAQEGYKKLLDSANDPAISAEEKQKRMKTAEIELGKLKEMNDTLETFNRTARSTLGETQRRMRDNILAEIKDVIKTKAKAGNFTFVLDAAAESANNTPVVLYTNGDGDLTDDVLKELNDKAPAPKPPTETVPPKK